MQLYCGIDWSERHHDIAVIDSTGTLLGKQRVNDDAAGFRALLEFLAAHGADPGSTPVAIETDKGLFVSALIGAGYALHAINPVAAARYRERHTVSKAKSDHGDALMLANVLRTDAHQHRQIPADSHTAQAVRVLARAQQDAVADRLRIQSKIRSTLKLFFPAALGALPELGVLAAAEVLLTVPTPEHVRRLRRPQIRAALVRAGRQRRLDEETERIFTALKEEQLRLPAQVEAAMGHQILALAQLLRTCLHGVAELEAQIAIVFDAHPDAEVLRSFPGLGPVLAARLLAEVGDDRTRFADARALKNFAGTAPITRASGTRHRVYARYVRNWRMADLGHYWAFASLTHSPGAKAHYDRRRRTGDTHNMAARHLANRYLGLVFTCLQRGEHYSEHKAFPAAAAAPGSSEHTAAGLIRR